MYIFVDIFVSFAIVVQTAIGLIAKTVASGLVNCQEITLSDVYFYAALGLLNKIGYKIFIISLLNIMQYLLLTGLVNNRYCMSARTMQGGVV
jgi:hypothetical protein